jgi:hypothetical protein
MRFDEGLLPAWRHDDEDLGRWEFEGVTHREILLVSLDQKGREERQTWSLDDGRRIDSGSSDGRDQAGLPGVSR